MTTLLAVVGVLFLLQKLLPGPKGKIIKVAVNPNAVYPIQFDDLISNASQKFGLPKSLIAAVIYTEAGNDPAAVGDNGNSFGLMQVQCRTARDMEFQGQCTQLKSPHSSVFFGSKYLRNRIDKYGLELGVLSYNTGSPTRAGKLFDPNQYRDKVFSAYRKFEQEGRG